MSASAPVRVLMAGAGAFGGEHLARLAVRADVELVGVADPDPAEAVGRRIARGERHLQRFDRQ